jgi:hypothetical protein
MWEAAFNSHVERGSPSLFFDGMKSLSGRLSPFFCQFARIGYMQKLRFDLTDDVRAHISTGSLGQVRKFSAEIAPS